MSKKLTVREAESLSRRVATDRIRNKAKYLDPVIIEMEKSFTESLGTRVRIEKNKEGGTVTIDFFSPDDLRGLLEKVSVGMVAGTKSQTPISKQIPNSNIQIPSQSMVAADDLPVDDLPVDDRPTEEIKKDENEDLYSLKNFSI
jgi:hypothetical protein